MEYDERFIPDGMNGFERNVKRIVDCMIAVILMILFFASIFNLFIWQ